MAFFFIDRHMVELLLSFSRKRKINSIQTRNNNWKLKWASESGVFVTVKLFLIPEDTEYFLFNHLTIPPEG